MNSVLGIGENIVFINKGYREWVGNKELIYETTNEALSHFVFATDLFQKSKNTLSTTHTDNKRAASINAAFCITYFSSNQITSMLDCRRWRTTS